MLLKNLCPTLSLHQHHQTHQTREDASFYNSPHQTSPFTAASSDLDLDLNNIDLENDARSQSLSSSPISTQSLLSQYSAAQAQLDHIPTITAPREGQQSALFDFPPDTPSLFGSAGLMHPDLSFSAGQLTPRSAARLTSSHHRESSLSSLGSAGPASPYSQNTSNPHIAVADSVGDGFSGLHTQEEFYHLAGKALSGHDAFYANYPNYASADAAAHPAYSNIMASHHRQKNERGLLPPPDFPGSHGNRSRPVSVASSITSDSPLTPSGEPDESERRRKNVFNPVPKLDRTMTDIYGDELFNPNFTITSASPGQMPASPHNEVFVQRVKAANTQHLSAVHSPISTTSRDRSPFRHGSPLAPAPTHDFPNMVFGSAQQLREQRKAAQDAQAVQQQLARSSSIGTPQTISPKDAVLEYHTPEGEANFPLFPQQNSAPFDGNQLKGVSQSQHSFDQLPIDQASFNNYVTSQLPTSVQVPQQYPSYMPQARQQNVGTPMTNGSMAPSRLSSAESGQSDSSNVNSTPERPTATSADGGTYTCTYHGCTLRFETPALLQKHKREGHRQAHGINGPRRPDIAPVGMTSSLLNSQAGPHKCERINPSTGKPCSTIFSRPYDLTRHEDTIHNARKQKVRCDLCTDEKTFSRADALTRHYRVCHPDVELPGKFRRRGGHSG